jgi:zinc protease
MRADHDVAGRRRLALLVLPLSLLWAAVAEALPEIETWHTDKGARVLFVAAPELPMVDLRLVFDAGSARDGERHGVAHLTNALLDQSAAGLDADEIARGFEQLGAEIGNGSERDMAWLSLRSLTEPRLLEPSLELFAKVVSRADFPEADFEREQQRVLVALEYQKQKPKAIIEDAFYGNLYGDHPYAGDPVGTEETVKRLDTAALRDFYRRYYVARNATLVIVGAVSRQQAEDIAARVAGSLPEGEAPTRLEPVKELAGAERVFIEFPASQSHVLMGMPGVRRGDADYFPLYVGNHILGGSGLVSRISEEIREKRGLSYSAYSYFLPMKRKGPYMMGFQTRNDQREEALKVLRETLQDFIEKGPTDDELESAKSNIVGGFPLRVSSNGKITEYLAMIGFYNLPLDYLNTFTGRVQKVTAEQIQDAFARRVPVERMVTVIVGAPDSAAAGS